METSFPKDTMPAEVEVALLSLGLEIKSCKLIKLSFHSTYLVEVSGGARTKVIVQLLGSQLGDKPLFRVDRPISAESIRKASELAREAGVRVPDILSTGTVDKCGSLSDVPYVAYEFIETETVEDEVIAPGNELSRIIESIRQSLKSRPLTDVDTEPIQRFDDVNAFIANLKNLATEAKAPELLVALDKIAAETVDIVPQPVVLIHQDLNDGNTLCSRDAGGSGSWHLDAMIDWEGACVADPRLAWDRSEPWQTLRLLALAVRGSWLKAVVEKGGHAMASLPRCQMEELCEDDDDVKSKLVAAGRLKA